MRPGDPTSKAHRLFARIRRGSKYAYQNDWVKEKPEQYGGWPFAVEIHPGDPAGYVVVGGPGGRYRLADVTLYVVEGGQEVRIS